MKRWPLLLLALIAAGLTQCSKVREEPVARDAAATGAGPSDVRVTLVSPHVRGFHAPEGPYPQWKMPRTVRWMSGAQAEIDVAGGPHVTQSFGLDLNALSAAEGQRLEVLVNGVPVARHSFQKANEWERVVSDKFSLTSAQNRLVLRASRTLTQDGRELGVLFDEISVSRR